MIIYRKVNLTPSLKVAEHLRVSGLYVSTFNFGFHVSHVDMSEQIF